MLFCKGELGACVKTVYVGLADVGTNVGLAVDGCAVDGEKVGSIVGAGEGAAEGFVVGDAVEGTGVGDAPGACVGSGVGGNVTCTDDEFALTRPRAP